MVEDSGQELTHELMDLSAAVDLIAQAAAARLGVHQTDLICLHLLVRHGPMGAGEVAAALGVTTAAVSTVASRLEAGGFAHREMDSHDRRRVLLHASPAGTRRAFELFEGLYAGVGEAFAKYRKKDVEMLVELLRTYRQLVTDHTAALRGAGKQST